MQVFNRSWIAATLICAACFCCELRGQDIAVIDAQTAGDRVIRPQVTQVRPGQMVEVRSETPITQWMIWQPADLVAQVYDRVGGVDGSRLVFKAPPKGRVIIWRFQGQSDSAFPVMASFVIDVTGKPTPPAPAPDGPDNPDPPTPPDPKPPTPPTPPPAPVIPNAFGVGQPVYDAVMKLHVNHRKAYAEKIAQVWSSTGARLAATQDAIDPAMEAIAPQTKAILGADSAVWNPYGDAVEAAIQAALDSGKLKKTDRAQVVQLCKEVAEALRIAGGQP